MSTKTETTPRSNALARLIDGEHMDLAVVHDLKNSLTAVKALVQLGSRNPAEAASHERLALIEREFTRMQETLQRCLSPSGRVELRPTRVDLGALASDTLLLLSARAREARVTLVSRGHAIVVADPRRLTDALLNLVANGIEATPPGGEVAVHVRACPNHAEIVVRDTGRGMPEETLRRLGTPFFTTREDGSGLGVMLARAVISLHGGSLNYESEPGKGTTVRATLRRAEAA
jgi:signal transduction histidine kinase